MLRGSPDYAFPQANVFGYQGGAALYAQAESTGYLAAGGWETIPLVTIPSDYTFFAQACLVSASGTDTMHRFDVLVNTVTLKKYYFGDNAYLLQASHIIAEAGDTIFLVFYNYDAVARKILWSGIGTLTPTGTKPLKPDWSEKPKPELKEGESLWLVENPIDGKKWVVAKTKKVEV